MRKHLARLGKFLPRFKSLLLSLTMLLVSVGASVAADYPEGSDSKSTVVNVDQKSISGKVTDPDGLPLPGATVVVKGTVNGMATDIDGNFAVSGVEEGDVLLVAFVGFRTQEVTVGSQSTIIIALEVDAIGIEEVVTIGYGVQKKTTITREFKSCWSGILCIFDDDLYSQFD